MPTVIHRERYLSLFATRVLSDDDKSAFDKLSKAEQEKFFLKLRATLDAAKFGYVIAIGPPVSVAVYTRIPITNSLTESVFLDSVDEIGFGAALANDTIELELGSADRLH